MGLSEAHPTKADVERTCATNRARLVMEVQPNQERGLVRSMLDDDCEIRPSEPDPVQNENRIEAD